MWDENFYDKLRNFKVPDHMIDRATIGQQAFIKPLKILFEHRTLPDEGFSNVQIRLLLHYLSTLDSDKDPEAIRIGEREGRISTPLLAELSGNFCHGVGRSGELNAPQPKAAGASLMQNLTNKIVLSLIKEIGLPNIKGALTTPFGTGMCLAMALRGALNFNKIDIHKKPIVLMTQIDHKSPRKGIEFIGGKLKIIAGIYGKNYHAPEGVFVPFDEIKKKYHQNKEKVCAIISSNCFFAPRVPDDLKEIAKFAQKHNLIHIINNAYGIQVESLNTNIRKAIDAGRVDAVVQSTDKCFLTPVGGAVILSNNVDYLKITSTVYAGRASASPVLHLLTSLLSIGKIGYRQLMQEQVENRQLLEDHLKILANKINEHIIQCKNPVSCAMSLKNYPSSQIEKLGGYLYNLRVTGPRVLNPDKNNFGTSTKSNEIPYPYIVMNAAIGVKRHHIIKAISRLEQALNQI